MPRTKITIQTSADWVRIAVNNVPVIDGPTIDPDELRNLLKDLGFPCILQRGIFGGDDGEECDEYDYYTFEILKEER